MPSLQSTKRRSQGYKSIGERFQDQDLRSLSAPLSHFTNAAFSDCEMGLADFTGAIITGAVFSGCRLYGARFNCATLVDVNFLDCDLEQAGFQTAVLRGVHIGRTRAAYATFQAATMKDVKFWGTNLHGADLDFIEAGRVGFEDCNLWGAKVALGCAFFQSTFDEVSCQRFAAMLARVYPSEDVSERLKSIAGFQFKVVDRLMKPPDEIREEAASA